MGTDPSAVSGANADGGNRMFPFRAHPSAWHHAINPTCPCRRREQATSSLTTANRWSRFRAQFTSLHRVRLPGVRKHADRDGDCAVAQWMLQMLCHTSSRSTFTPERGDLVVAPRHRPRRVGVRRRRGTLRADGTRGRPPNPARLRRADDVVQATFLVHYRVGDGPIALTPDGSSVVAVSPQGVFASSALTRAASLLNTRCR